MCDPISLAISAAAMSAFGAYSQADAQKQQANYQAQVDRNNATIASQQRSDALQRGEIAAEQSMQKQAQMLGQQRASLAANGVDLTEGSAQDLLATTKFLGAADVNTIQSNAAREAWGYSIQGMNSSAAAALDQWKADNTNPVAIGAMSGFGSLLNSASSYAIAKAGAKDGATTKA